MSLERFKVSPTGRLLDGKDKCPSPGVIFYRASEVDARDAAMGEDETRIAALALMLVIQFQHLIQNEAVRGETTQFIVETSKLNDVKAGIERFSKRCAELVRAPVEKGGE